MVMKQRILTAAVLAAPWITTIHAADPQLLNLVMPDAKVLAGVNVDTAKASLFGQYLIMQLQAQDPNFQQFVTQTGFDPTKDLDELLVASNGATSSASHLTLARGTFNISQITAAAAGAGYTMQTYNGVTVMVNPKGVNGFAFLSPTLAVAGDVASVQGAIGRQTTPSTLPASLLVIVNQLSGSEDAWGVSEVPPPAIKPPASANLPTVPGTVFQNIQQASGGVLFGAQVTLTAQLQADNAQDATAMANVLQFVVNLGEMQAQQNAQALGALKALTITTSGSIVSIAGSITETQLEALMQVKHSQASPNLRRPKAQEQQRF
jgi:hypothetical protein